MADGYLDELMDGPSKRPTRTSRFLPKGLKPKTMPETKSSLEMDIEVKPRVSVKTEVKKEETDDLTEMETEELREEDATAEAEDRIVREIDGCFAPSFDPNTRLYVLQYPLRPLWRPYELEERCKEVRVKPASSEMEVDLTVNVNSKNYDSGTSGADPRSQPKQTLHSSWKPPHTSGLAIGVLTGNKLYLNPVHAVVQLRPSMKHLDCKRKAAMSDNLEEAEGESSAASKKLIKPSMQNKDIGEGWVPLKYHDTKSYLYEKYMKKMMAEEGSPINFSMSSHNYLNSLCGTLDDSSMSKGPPIRSLSTLPVKERFKTWLVTGQIHRFDVLKHLAPEESVENVLEILQELAQLVQGLWVPKTRLVYPESSENDFIRDYVLLLFSKEIFITNSQIHQCARYAEGVRKFLRTLAVERPTFDDWKLKEPADRNFIKLNPSVVEKQKGEWERMESKITKHLRIGPASSRSSSNTNQVTSKSSSKVVTRISKG